MKSNAVLARSLLLIASLGLVAPLVAQTAPAPAKTEAAPEEPAVIEGVELPRKSGEGFLGVTVQGPKLVLKFYDADKKPVAVDVARAAARWDPVNRTSDVRTVLNPDAAGSSLVSPAVVQPPLVFKIYLTLLDAGGNGVESYVVDMRDLNKPKS